MTAASASSTSIAPLQLDRIVRCRPDGSRAALDSYWGLIPSWGKDRGAASLLINARAESLMATASFRPLIARNRRIIPATTFYEWAQTPTGRRPIVIRRQDGRGLALAGLWTTWADPA